MSQQAPASSQRSVTRDRPRRPSQAAEPAIRQISASSRPRRPSSKTIEDRLPRRPQQADQATRMRARQPQQDQGQSQPNDIMRRMSIYLEARRNPSVPSQITPTTLAQAHRQQSSCVLTQVCPICHNYDTARNDSWYRLSCGHIYHRTCIARWFRTKDPARHTCPECRQVYNPELSGDCTNNPQPPVDLQPPSQSGSAQGGGNKATCTRRLPRPSAPRRASPRPSAPHRTKVIKTGNPPRKSR